MEGNTLKEEEYIMREGSMLREQEYIEEVTRLEEPIKIQ